MYMYVYINSIYTDKYIKYKYLCQYFDVIFGKLSGAFWHCSLSGTISLQKSWKIIVFGLRLTLPTGASEASEAPVRNVSPKLPKNLQFATSPSIKKWIELAVSLSKLFD